MVRSCVLCHSPTKGFGLKGANNFIYSNYKSILIPQNHNRQNKPKKSEWKVFFWLQQNFSSKQYVSFHETVFIHITTIYTILLRKINSYKSTRSQFLQKKTTFFFSFRQIKAFTKEVTKYIYVGSWFHGKMFSVIVFFS